MNVDQGKSCWIVEGGSRVQECALIILTLLLPILYPVFTVASCSALVRLQARCLYEEVCEGQEAALGPTHSETLHSKDSLATLCYEMRDLPAARKLREVRSIEFLAQQKNN